ncbi:MAG: YIP1 family protein [Anaerolineae bacterium]|nr:YIP1 family protein [Anaerolineae bacterium]
MYQQFGTPSGTPMTWSETWTKALTKPSEETFVEIANDPNASSGRALTWVFIASIISAVIGVGLQALFGPIVSPQSFGGTDFEAIGMGSLTGASLLSLVCVAPIAAVVGVALFALVVGVTNVVAKALGGTGNYDKLIYATAAYAAPLSLVSSVVSGIPIVRYIGFVIGIYGLVLNVIAVKAVHQFSWGKAVMSSLVIWVLLAILFCLCVFALLSILGPAVGNIFSNISRSI